MRPTRQPQPTRDVAANSREKCSPAEQLSSCQPQCDTLIHHDTVSSVMVLLLMITKDENLGMIFEQ